MGIVMAAVYFILLFYAQASAPRVFFRAFKFRDTPEYAFAYFLSCILMTVTLMSIPLRIWQVLYGSEDGR